jgi:hypothetical protein
LTLSVFWLANREHRDDGVTGPSLAGSAGAWAGRATDSGWAAVVIGRSFAGASGIGVLHSRVEWPRSLMMLYDLICSPTQKLAIRCTEPKELHP